MNRDFFENFMPCDDEVPIYTNRVSRCNRCKAMVPSYRFFTIEEWRTLQRDELQSYIQVCLQNEHQIVQKLPKRRDRLLNSKQQSPLVDLSLQAVRLVKQRVQSKSKLNRDKTR